MDDLIKACQKFVWKCENGLARSTETYNEVVQALTKLGHYPLPKDYRYE